MHLFTYRFDDDSVGCGGTCVLVHPGATTEYVLTAKNAVDTATAGYIVGYITQRKSPKPMRFRAY
jgi:hypothetical protein